MTKDDEWLLDEKYGGVETEAFLADKERLARGEPLGYIIGSEPFLGLTIHLDSKPLIPRSETEWWADQLLATIQGDESGSRNSTVGLGQAARSAGEFRLPDEAPQLRFLDLCAGSGAIGCAALARLPRAHVYFGEIDPAHEATITKNIRENGLDMSRADIRIGDLFEPFQDMRFDIIAANPPYIPSGRDLPNSVAHYEPALALFAEDDGLGIIRRIAADLPVHLADGGVAWIECDSEHAEAAKALFIAQGLSAEIRTDQYDRPRVLVVHPALTQQ